ncbi:SIS domain-containing protein [Acerihabitans sp. KWT182]|uniref:SIS domain-containing protein n=1 Tax=Acerihabitans sp. KWT182 TaxID=3157919 RepID=A0AAU7QH11_9GAMM
MLQDLADTTTAHIQQLCRPEGLAAIVSAAKTLSAARDIYCLGLRSSFPVAFHFCHVAAYFQHNVHLVEGAGESGIMSLMSNLGPKDALLVCSLSPYSRRSVALTRYLSQRKVKIIAISDNASSPVARLAGGIHFGKKADHLVFRHPGAGILGKRTVGGLNGRHRESGCARLGQRHRGEIMGHGRVVEH